MKTNNFFIRIFIAYIIIFILGLMVVITCSCDDDTNQYGEVTMSCTYYMSNIKYCIEANLNEESQFKNECTLFRGTISSSCSSTDKIGSCTIFSDNITVKVVYYEAENITANTTKQSCESFDNAVWSTE